MGRWARIADTACGIGTQLIGLAASGYRMYGSDLSLGALARAHAECARRGLDADLAVADRRALPRADRSMDAAVCADNAIPHLLTDDDALAALGELVRVLRPMGRVAITTRAYDAMLRSRPTSTPPQVMEHAELGRTISFQLHDTDRMLVGGERGQVAGSRRRGEPRRRGVDRCARSPWA